ncbi:MAG TPA: hypothetical protein VF989_07605, partial [Polyangiaceae bacterium]
DSSAKTNRTRTTSPGEKVVVDGIGLVVPELGEYRIIRRAQSRGSVFLDESVEGVPYVLLQGQVPSSREQACSTPQFRREVDRDPGATIARLAGSGLRHGGMVPWIQSR